jgi:hypothetical protein
VGISEGLKPLVLILNLVENLAKGAIIEFNL